MIGFLRGTVTPKDWGIVGGILLATLLLAAGFYFVVMKSMAAQIVELDTEYKELSLSVKKAQNTRDNIQALQEESKMYQDLVSQFEQRLPEAREIPQMLKQFESKANAISLRVKLSSMTPIPEANKETIPFKITANGDFHQIVEFINELEREDRYFKINDIVIDEQIDGISESEFVLSTFRFIQQEPAPSKAEAEAEAGSEKK